VSIFWYLENRDNKSLSENNKKNNVPSSLLRLGTKQQEDTAFRRLGCYREAVLAVASKSRLTDRFQSVARLNRETAK